MTADDLMSRIIPYVKGCPTPIAEVAVSDTMRDFLKQTRIWKQELNPEYTIADDPAIVLNTGCGAEIYAVTSLTVDDEEETEYSFQPPVTVTLDEAPTESSLEVVATAELITPHGYTDIPQIVEPWIEGISYGAIARLTDIPGTAWFSPEMSAYMRAKYASSVNEARGHKLREGRNAPLSIRPRGYV